MSKTWLFLGMVSICMLTGCAGNSPKDFDKKLARLHKKGIVLATVTSENKIDGADKLQPGSFVIGEGDKDRQKEYLLYASNHFRVCSENSSHCLIVLEVNEGRHTLSSVRGAVLGDFFLPVFEAQVLQGFQATLNQITYIGNIHLILRKKTSASETSAGKPLVPTRIIDQMAIAGATMDVTINDEYERDISEFEQAFPNLKNHTVKRRVLSPTPEPSMD